MKLELTINGISLKAYLSFFSPLSYFTVCFMLGFILHSLRSVVFSSILGITYLYKLVYMFHSY